jgi:hypothetical protein
VGDERERLRLPPARLRPVIGDLHLPEDGPRGGGCPRRHGLLAGEVQVVGLVKFPLLHPHRVIGEALPVGRVERQGAEVRPEERREAPSGRAESGGPGPALAAAAAAAHAVGGAEAGAGAEVGRDEERSRGEAASCDVPGVRDAAQDVGEDRRREGVQGVAGGGHTEMVSQDVWSVRSPVTSQGEADTSL